MGPEMMDKFRDQAKRFGAECVFETVDHIDFSQRPFKVTAGNRQVLADALILSTGASANWLDLDAERRLMGHGVSACATCDGFFFRGKEVVVIGGGDSAMEEANFLTKFATKVTVIHRRNEFRASKIMQDRVLNNPKVEVLWNTVVLDIVGSKDTGVQAVHIRNVETGQEQEYATQGVFVAIGHSPNSKLVANHVTLDAKGYIEVAPHSTETNIPGVFACGDVVDKKYRQAITAAGMGCMAAIDAERFLEAHPLPTAQSEPAATSVA